MHPPLRSHDHGWLDVGDGHAVYWEVAGNPLGLPALFVHGGPGAGCTAEDRRWFDPRRYRIVLFDQRGSGRSRPLGRLEGNDTDSLVRDIEALRRHLHIERWLLFGGSWGATLALAYTERHPARVRALVLRGVFTATERERSWLYAPHGAATLQPVAWQRLTTTLVRAQHGDVPGAFAAQLHCGQAATEVAAALAWLRWEQDLMAAESAASANSTATPTRDASAALAMSRIGVHFARHAFFFAEAQLLARSSRLHRVPGRIVQGRRDLVTPLAAAEALHAVWPGSELRLVEDAGHAAGHPALAQQLIAATDFFATDFSPLTFRR